ncbi:MAG: choice-of-anchor D domain-containing protein [Ignavibacteriales bacterium]|jgi:hypothetical protein|nr:MAG: choice-of-anchor D domain-containing protein [Ignavibacteriaceae bacterium]MBV6444418.1 hypothetical protein [Ignavibacteriaceae bacterium]MBZ0197223.1 choice-of-anchor D domain-containing protein [Ignavibacteriaceae bacterium]MCZ2143541.1 choice-of-anchor D domain-containing protein [Ignavibacteriales bacterium]WKZ72135.1 MAG: choice-of-anchor D domain-containing protein [Ignavibacteriaceae bacterium]
MFKIRATLSTIVLLALPLLAQTNPALFNLSTGAYSFTEWAAANAAGTYPANMKFHRTSTQDPELGVEMSSDYTLAYNLATGPRINGLGAEGISFVNTGTSGNLGAATVGLNATGRENIKVYFTAQTKVVGARTYGLRLQYRIGNGTWLDVPGPVEYISSGTQGHSLAFGPLTLPAECNNQAELYLRWKYYSISGSGTRPEIRLDDISVVSSPVGGAQTYTTFRTEAIDGNNGFSELNEKFNTTRQQISAYITWDADYLYFAYSGNTPGGSLTDNDRAIHLYIDTDPKPNPTDGTGTTSADAWRWAPTLPFSANYHYTFKTSDITEYRKQFDGSAWVPAGFTTANFKNPGTGYWEMSIKRADLGNPKQINLVAYVEEDWDNTASITGGVPSNLFTDNTTQGAIAFNPHFLNVSFIDKMIPGSAFTVDNHGWSLRLKATTTGYADTTAMAGMFRNATDDYDAGLDHPKAVAPPNNYLSVYFPRDDWESMLGPKFERDFKSLIDLSNTTKTWTLTVRSDQTGDITLSAASFEDIPANYEIKLKDNTNNTVTDLRAGSYTYTNGNAVTRNFELTIGVPPTNPLISIVPDTLQFGNVKTNATSTLAVTISNLGELPLTVNSMGVSGAGFSFVGSGAQVTLNQNDTIVRHVKFAPSSVAAFTGSLVVTSNDPLHGTVTVPLFGAGVLAAPGITVRPSTLDFGSTLVGTTANGSVWVKNTGGDAVDLVVSSVPVLRSGQSPFTFTGALPVTVPYGDSVSLPFAFTPSAEGAATGTASIVSNAPSSPTDVQLTGTGTYSSVSHNFSAGWNLMSIPINPTSSLASDILAGFPLYYLYGYSGGNYVTSTVLVPARGYWLGTEVAGSVSVSGLPITSDQTFSLAGGWNMIASPFVNGTAKADVRIQKNGTFYTIEEAVNQGYVQRPIYIYSNGSGAYDTTTTLSAWNGNWFFANDNDLNIKYLYQTEQTTPVKQEIIAAEATNDDWAVTVKTSANGAVDKYLVFGTNQSATSGYDGVFDLAKAPMAPASNAVESYFRHEGWSNFTVKYGADIREPYSVNGSKSWEFKVVSNKAGVVTLSWEDILAAIPQDIRNNYKFHLTGEGINAPVNMLQVTSYQFTAAEGVVYTFYINSNPVGVEDALMNLDFSLGQNYPNPFNPSTMILYSIKEAGQVSLVVYDILGNVVANLVDDYKQPGKYEVRFDAANLPSGIYFYKLVQGKNSDIKKLMLLK